MELRKATIKSSPFVGVFAKATGKFVLVPKQLQKKEFAGLKDFFGVEIIKVNIANSSLIGILSLANSHGVILPGLAEENELRQFEQAGIRAKRIHDINALGNLVALNDSRGIYSKSLSKETKKGIESFLKVELKQMKIAGSDLVGAALVATNRGFVVHARSEKKETEALEKFFGFRGKATTANYGDAFVSHSIVANDNAAIIGLHTTLHELLRIDEGLSGE